MVPTSIYCAMYVNRSALTCFFADILRESFPHTELFSLTGYE